MIRIKKGAFLYQKHKTSDQNTTKLSFSFLSLTSYLKSSFSHYSHYSHSLFLPLTSYLLPKIITPITPIIPIHYSYLLSLISYLKSYLLLLPLFLPLTSYLKSYLPSLPLFLPLISYLKSSLPLFPFIILTSYLLPLT